PVRAVVAAQHTHRGLRELGDLDELVVVQVRVVPDVPEGAHEHVARVVREAVEHDVGELTAGDHEAVVVGERRDEAERAVLLLARARDGPRGTVDVGHTVRGPQPFEAVRLARERLVHRQPPDRSRTARVMRAIASSTGTPLSCVPSRNRKETAPASASSPPAMSTKGTFWVAAVRIFLPKRSSERSTSARTPSALRRSTTSWREAWNGAATGTASTWTGASHAGNAPA